MKLFLQGKLWFKLILSKINNEAHNSHLNIALNENEKIKIIHGLKLKILKRNSWKLDNQLIFMI